MSSNEATITLPNNKTIKTPTGLFINNEFVDSHAVTSLVGYSISRIEKISRAHLLHF
ncbi:hypothetical protein Glove_219g25 [Diversispora epigaea]|uniref:Uncharacterized protein n=1 Tax=Diversispora epigaea TaxID=1348612 RepID=A0A397IPY9_9GLOM|nr:hypothetical protein Glove_219g25 [Diversispora epigaea]